MRLLHLDTGRSMRGGQYQALLLLEGLQEQGHSQTLLARAALLDRWPGRPIGVATLRRAAADADLIHAHDARAHMLAALWCPGKPLVVSRRVAFEIRRGVFSRWKYSRPRRYLAVSEYVAAKLRGAGVEPSKIEVVHDAVQPRGGEEMGDSPLCAERGMDSEELTRSALGTVPNFSGPLSAEGHAVAEQTDRIVAAYSDDPLKEGGLLESAAQQAGLPLHFSTDLPADLPTAGAFAYLSASEGLGSAILLAMVHRVPVVASRVGGIPEIVEHEQTGLLVNNDAVEIADALKRFRQDPDLAQACTERAYQQILERFTVDIMVRRTERVYHEILGLPTPS